MAKKKQSRSKLTIGAVALVVVALVYAFWPQPTLVDIGKVSRGSMILTIDEEARTRVRNAYTVSAPVSGRLLRVDAEPNDVVEQGVTIVARMLPSSPPTLDARQREQAKTAVQAAEATLGVERANLKNAVAGNILASKNVNRATEQREIGTISQSAYEQAQQEFDASEAALDSAKAAISLREAELANAQAALIGLANADQGLPDADQIPSDTINIKAPINGRVLQVLQKSEVILAAGAPILEIGNVEDDLEIIVELLSTDAVQVTEGDKVIIQNWGGSEPLAGVVDRIDPFGFTKFSALGVEEQRVNVIIRFTDVDREKVKLGHGFRVEVQIVIWENDDAVIVSASALFRKNDQWAVFVVEGGDARLKTIDIGRNNGTESNVISGLKLDDRVVLYPASELEDGTSVESRQGSK